MMRGPLSLIRDIQNVHLVSILRCITVILCTIIMIDVILDLFFLFPMNVMVLKLCILFK